MADQKTLTNWIVSHQRDLDLRIKDCSWIRVAFPGWHDLDVSITVNGQVFTGRGSNIDADTALSKAFCEAFERCICSAYQIPSVGIAGHFNDEEAKINARLEFVERELLTRYILNRVLPEPLQIFSPLKTRYLEQGIELNFYQLSVAPVNVILALAEGRSALDPFGGILGLGASDNKEQSSQKAVIECLRSVEAFMSTPSKSISIEDFRTIVKPTGFQRQALLQNPEYFARLKGSLKFGFVEQAQSESGQFESLELPGLTLHACPLKFYRYSEKDIDIPILEFVG